LNPDFFFSFLIERKKFRNPYQIKKGGSSIVGEEKVNNSKSTRISGSIDKGGNRIELGGGGGSGEVESEQGRLEFWGELGTIS